MLFVSSSAIPPHEPVKQPRLNKTPMDIRRIAAPKTMIVKKIRVIVHRRVPMVRFLRPHHSEHCIRADADRPATQDTVPEPPRSR